MANRYKVIKDHEGYRVGSIIELNDRRAQSEMRRGNIVLCKEDKRVFKTKEAKLDNETK